MYSGEYIDGKRDDKPEDVCMKESPVNSIDGKYEISSGLFYGRIISAIV